MTYYFDDYQSQSPPIAFLFAGDQFTLENKMAHKTAVLWTAKGVSGNDVDRFWIQAGNTNSTCTSMDTIRDRQDNFYGQDLWYHQAQNTSVGLKSLLEKGKIFEV